MYSWSTVSYFTLCVVIYIHPKWRTLCFRLQLCDAYEGVWEGEEAPAEEEEDRGSRWSCMISTPSDTSSLYICAAVHNKQYCLSSMTLSLIHAKTYSRKSPKTSLIDLTSVRMWPFTTHCIFWLNSPFFGSG